MGNDMKYKFAKVSIPRPRAFCLKFHWTVPLNWNWTHLWFWCWSADCCASSTYSPRCRCSHRGDIYSYSVVRLRWFRFQCSVIHPARVGGSVSESLYFRMKFLVSHPSLAKKNSGGLGGIAESEKRKDERKEGKKDYALCKEMLVSMATRRHVLMCMMTSRIHILLAATLLLLLLLRLLAGCWQCVFLHAAPAAVTCQVYRRSFVLETWETLRGLESNLRETSDTPCL